MPPFAVTPHERFGEAPPQRALRAAGLDNRFVAPVEHDGIAESLRAGFGERQADEASAARLTDS
jgi:hypothetical protein